MIKINVLSLIFLLTMCVTNVFSIPITFTHKGIGSGELGGLSFADKAFTITSQADTDNRQSYSSGFFLDHTLSSIEISDLGVYSFNTATRTFVHNTSGIVGFSRAGSTGADLFNGPTNTLFKTWDMLSGIGPISGTGRLMQWYPSSVSTDGGILEFNDGSTVTTFEASTTAPVPEPATLLLLGSGLAGLAFYRRKRK